MLGNLAPYIIVFSEEAYGRWLGPEGGAFLKEISALTKETQSSFPLCHVKRQQWENSYVWGQETGPHLTLRICLPWFWTLYSRTAEINVCYLQPLIYFYSSPKQNNTNVKLRILSILNIIFVSLLPPFHFFQSQWSSDNFKTHKCLSYTTLQYILVDLEFSYSFF